MCQIESVFHHACAHWAARPRFVGEPCVRARHVAVSPQPTTTITNTETHNNTAVTIIPCDYPDHLGAADEVGECAECARRRRRCPVFVFGAEEEAVAGYDGSEEDGEGTRRSSVDSDMTMSSSSSSSSSTSYGCSDGESGSKRSWRPFAGLSEGAWEELKRVQARRERKIRGVGRVVGVLAEEVVVVVG